MAGIFKGHGGGVPARGSSRKLQLDFRRFEVIISSIGHESRRVAKLAMRVKQLERPPRGRHPERCRHTARNGLSARRSGVAAIVRPGGKPEMNSPTRHISHIIYFALFATLAFCAPMLAQDVLGGITGTVKDSTGAAVPDVTVRARNIGTNLEVIQHTQGNGSYVVGNIPAGAY